MPPGQFDGPDRQSFTPYVVLGLRLAAAVNHKITGVTESGPFEGTLKAFALPLQRGNIFCSGEYSLRIALTEPKGGLHVIDVRICAKKWHSGSSLVTFLHEGGTTKD